MRTLLRACWNCLRRLGEGTAYALASVGSEWAFAREVRSREPMEDEAFWTTSYKQGGIPFEIATTVRRIYGEQLGHDYRKLRAGDFDPQMLDIDTVEMVMEIDEAEVSIAHEASVSRIQEEQLFYLMSRGLSETEASTMIVNGFIEPLVKELPMEYAVEMNRLIELQMEGSVG